jgi:hypothetical protein
MINSKHSNFVREVAIGYYQVENQDTYLGGPDIILELYIYILTIDLRLNLQILIQKHAFLNYRMYVIYEIIKARL